MPFELKVLVGTDERENMARRVRKGETYFGEEGLGQVRLV